MDIQMRPQMRMTPDIFFSIQVEAKKNTAKHVRTCKLSSGIGLRQGCRGARFPILSGGVLCRKKKYRKGYNAISTYTSLI